MSGRYIRQKPYVSNDGIYVPVHEYVPEGTESMYTCVMTREMFVEAYEKWIKPTYDTYTPSHDYDDGIDDWCD